MARLLLWKRHPRSQLNHPPAIIGIIAAVVGGVGIGLGIEALNSAPKAPAQAPLPTETAAANTASAAQTQQRQSALAAGAATNVTQGSGIILGSDVSSVSLVGTN